MISEQAQACPNCGAPQPAKQDWDGYGFEYKSDLAMMGLPLLHISFKYSPDRRPVPAKGVIAIGQFAIGYLSIGQFAIGFFALGQFGIGVISLAQIGIAAYIIAQIAVGYVGLAQFGLFFSEIVAALG